MAGDVKTKQLLFGGQQFVLRPFHQAGPVLAWLGRRLVLHHTEQRTLTALAILDDAGGVGQRAINGTVEGGTRFTQPITGTAFNECFKHFAVYGPRIHSLAKIRQRLELSALAPRLQNTFHRHFPDAFDGSESKSNGAGLRFGI